MLRHRVFRLKSRVSVLGLELTDWVVILVSWLILKQTSTTLLGDRLSFLIAIIGTFLVFRLWQKVKDTMPDKYPFHLIGWLTEADVYRLSPDLKNVPLVVYPEALQSKEVRPIKEVSGALAAAEG